MKKRVGVVLIVTALLLSGRAIVSPLELMETYFRAIGETGKQSASQRDSDAAEAGDEKRKAGYGAASGEDPMASSGGNENTAESHEEEADGRDDGYVKGVTTDYGWESQYWNLRFTAPEDVFMLSDEGIGTIMGRGQEVLSENYDWEQSEYAADANVYEMMAATARADTNMIVMVEKLLMRGLTSENYRKAALLQLKLLNGPAYTILDDSGTAEIAGETYTVVNTQVEYNGTYYQDYYFRVVDDRALCITITYLEETADQAEEFLDSFDVY